MTKFALVSQDEIPTHCNICKNAITLSNPIRFVYLETHFKNKFLPQVVFCYPCYDDNEKEITTNKFNPRPFLDERK